MICSKCKIDKQETCFHYRNKSKGLRKRQCIPCDKETRRKSYVKHKTDVIKKNTQTTRNIRLWYKDWKSKQSCCICSETEAACLDLHHLDPAGKDFSLSQLSYAGSIKTVQREIDKCVVLCANCHRKVHAGVLHIEQFMGP